MHFTNLCKTVDCCLLEGKCSFFFFLSIVAKDDKQYFCTTELSLNHCWKEKDCLPTLVILLELQRHEVNMRS